MWTQVRHLFARASVAALSGSLALVAGVSLTTCGVDDRQVAVVAPARPGPPALERNCLAAGCPADDACRTYADVSAVAGPDAGCTTLADCSPTWKPAARAGEACRCDDAGCVLHQGEACSAPGECDGGSCVATAEGSSVCCAQPCSEAEVCAPDGSTCIAADPCSNDALRCSGAKHQLCVAGVWQTLTDCGQLGCSLELAGCRRSAGQACEADTDCGEGSCLATADANKVCCTGACNGSCQRCSAQGTECVNIGDDEACGSIECPSDTCRLYDPATVVTNRCSDGKCATPEVACSVFQPQRADQECSASSLCDDQGSCSRGKKELLGACGSNEQCATGACVATAGGTSVCCSRACAPNEVCGPTGACVLAPTCSTGAVQCSSGNFQRCVAGQWTTEFACGALGCSLQRQGCFAGAGQSCTTSTDCGEGTCQPTAAGGSVCCTAACTGACKVCGATGTACTNLQDDNACGVVRCPADTACRDFPVSVSTQRCLAGSCGTPAQLCPGNAINAGVSCSNTNLCDNAGNCSQPKKGNGTGCASGSECATNNCVDGVCCNTACNGQCQTCAGTGLCHNTDTDASCGSVNCNNSPFVAECVSDHTNTLNACINGRCRVAADCGFQDSSVRCTQGGTCNGAGSCSPPSVACGGTTCPGNNFCCSIVDGTTGTIALRCSTAGQCPTVQGFTPGPFVEISCDQSSDCAGGQTCCVITGNTSSGVVKCEPTCTAEAVAASDPDFLGAPPEMLVVGPICAAPGGVQVFLRCPDGTCDDAPGSLPSGYGICR